tara:strand:- start:128 stop:1168 length:1041 start_codon:yes stop_codon:yes gene_type:complete
MTWSWADAWTTYQTDNISAGWYSIYYSKVNISKSPHGQIWTSDWMVQASYLPQNAYLSATRIEPGGTGTASGALIRNLSAESTSTATGYFNGVTTDGGATYPCASNSCNGTRKTYRWASEYHNQYSLSDFGDTVTAGANGGNGGTGGRGSDGKTGTKGKRAAYYNGTTIIGSPNPTSQSGYHDQGNRAGVSGGAGGLNTTPKWTSGVNSGHATDGSNKCVGANGSRGGNGAAGGRGGWGGSGGKGGYFNQNGNPTGTPFPAVHGENGGQAEFGVNQNVGNLRSCNPNYYPGWGVVMPGQRGPGYSGAGGGGGTGGGEGQQGGGGTAGSNWAADNTTIATYVETLNF